MSDNNNKKQFKKEAYQLTISINDYITLMDEIEKSIPKSKSLSWWTIMGILETDRKVINPKDGQLYY